MRVLRIEEAAYRLGLQPSTVRKLIYLGEISAVHPTKRSARGSRRSRPRDPTHRRKNFRRPACSIRSSW